MGHSVKKSSISTKNDWDAVLQLVGEQQSTFKGISPPKITISRPFILPLEGAKAKLKGVDSFDIYHALRAAARPIIFSNKNSIHPKITIIKFTGIEYYNDLILGLSDDTENIEGATIIISPNHLTKSKRRKESELVLLAKHFFESTYFIKLPLTTIKEYLDYAEHEHASLLLMPIKDLLAYVEMIKQTGRNHPFIPTAFQPERA
ncbi:MAG: hypothetical protein ACJAT1_001298 [Marivirga sp.]|jgi:hypothetical protein